MEPFIPSNQYDVLFALASGFTVEDVWADIVAPRIPQEPIDNDDLAAAVERSQGRIALVDGPDELLELLAKPLALWRIFLHPSQEEIAYRPSYWGSAQVTGGPGTGKTVVALHRVKHLTTAHELPLRAVLLTTFTRGLAEALERDLTALLDAERRRAVEVLNVDRWALGVVRAEHGTVTIADDEELRTASQAATSSPRPSSSRNGARWCWPMTSTPRPSTSPHRDAVGDVDSRNGRNCTSGARCRRSPPDCGATACGPS